MNDIRMSEPRPVEKSGIFFSCTEKQTVVREHVVPQIVLTHVHTGNLSVIEAGTRYSINQGETVLFNRNHLAKLTKHPQADQPYKSITVFFTAPYLQQYYTSHHIIPDQSPARPVQRFGSHPLLQSLFHSILPYYDMQESLPEELVNLKLTEAITILRKIDAGVDAVLTNFAEPGKIDISAFMADHYKFNIPLERFAYLSGRSLATFKRDFQKTFRTPPKKWLQQKRLQQAHFLIAEQKQKPSDVYLEVGFENLSHFSHAFKQNFGYNASQLLVSTATNSQ
jgi:AraC family transcriptional regulator, exoenzyme S synthesis regulatory protein ExsA